MNDFIRLPNRIINLSAIAFIDFDETHAILYTTGEAKLVVKGDDQAELLHLLENRYGVMTALPARLMMQTQPEWLG